MIKHRLIATLLVCNGNVVQTRRFRRTNVVGSAFTAVDFFNGWAIDEIDVLEISADDSYIERFIAIIDGLSRRCFVPLAVGGKIDDLGLVRRYTRAGADKVVINTHAVRRPDLIAEIADNYGRQCVVLSIDARPNAAMPSGYEVMISHCREETGLDAVEWAQTAVSKGAGEIMVNSLDHDGDKRGYDLELVKLMSNNVSVPVIAMGGVGQWQDFVDGITLGQADAVAAGNIFHYTEHSTKKAKEFMEAAGLNVRASQFYTVDIPRYQHTDRG